MKVLIIGPVAPIQGGIAQHTGNIAAALRRSGHSVDVISWKSQYPKVLYKGATYRAPADTAQIRWMLTWWNPLTWIRAGQVAAAYDRVIVPWVHPFQAVTLLTVATLAGPQRVVYHVHNVTPHEGFPFARKLARIVLRRSTRLVVHAGVLRDEIAALPVERPIAVVPHPSNIAIAATAPPAGHLKLLFLGYLREYKGADIGIEALALIRQAGVPATLTIAGSPWGSTDWDAVCRAAGVADAVTLQLEYVSDERMADLLEAHHMLIAPYRSATQSGVISLAFEAARPVVVTDVGGLAEFVTDGVNGAVCEPNSAAAFAQAVVRAWRDYAALQAGARVSAATWDDVCVEYVA